jgi:hypothetical protein
LYGSKVSPTISADIKTNSLWAVIGAMMVVGLYLVISFRKWQYSLGAIAAVLHDVIFVLGLYSLLYKYMPFHMEMDQHFIAAILTVIGYSMNDTVIVFDRVREFLAGNITATPTQPNWDGTYEKPVVQQEQQTLQMQEQPKKEAQNKQQSNQPIKTTGDADSKEEQFGLPPTPQMGNPGKKG